MTANLLIPGAGESGSQELAAILGVLWLLFVLSLLFGWIRRHSVRLIIHREPPKHVVTFPPEPTAYLRDVDPALLDDDQPEATDALFDTKRLIAQKAGK